jgi:hypothetical protein
MSAQPHSKHVLTGSMRHSSEKPWPPVLLIQNVRRPSVAGSAVCHQATDLLRQTVAALSQLNAQVVPFPQHLARGIGASGPDQL